MAMSRPRLGGEILEQCPYNAYHWVRPIKLDDHVAKCRKNHDYDLMKEKGYRQLSLTCQYNCRHRVAQTEYKYHMARCPDRKKLWSHVLKLGLLKDRFPDWRTAQDLPEKKEELEELYDGLKRGLLVGKSGQYKLASIRKGSRKFAQQAAEARGRAMAEEAAKAWTEMQEEEKMKDPSYQIRYTQEEIEYWNAPGMKGSGFNWLLYNSRTRANSTNYPVGLNKRERREWEIKYGEYLDKKHAKEKAAMEATAAVAVITAAAKEEGEGNQGTETISAGDGESDVGEKFPDFHPEEEDEDGWISQFTHGPPIMNRFLRRLNEIDVKDKRK